MEDVLSDLSMTPREGPILCCGTPLVGSPVVFPAVAQMTLVDPVSWMHRNLTLCTDQGQVFINCDTAVIEKDVMVGTQAEDVVRRVGSVMGCSERSDMRCLRVGTGWGL
jgi:hypothetical protein